MRPQRRQSPHRDSTGTLPALERQPRRPPHLGAATPAARITPPRTSTGATPRNCHAGHRHAHSRDFRILTIRKPEGGELLDWQKEFNKQINKIRYVIEQVIANFKTWRIMHTDYRRPLATFPE